MSEAKKRQVLLRVPLELHEWFVKQALARSVARGYQVTANKLMEEVLTESKNNATGGKHG